MPHAEEPITNGEMPSSQTLSHLSSYPVVSDSISAYKANPIGAQSLALANSAQDTLIKPVLANTKTAQSYIHPYVTKADELGDSALKHLDSHFPLITKDTETVKTTLSSYLLAPIVIPLGYANWGKRYIVSTYSKEYKSCGGDGVIAAGKAVITTSLTALAEAAQYLHKQLAETEEKGEALVKQAKDTVERKVKEVKSNGNAK